MGASCCKEDQFSREVEPVPATLQLQYDAERLIFKYNNEFKQQSDKSATGVTFLRKTNALAVAAKADEQASEEQKYIPSLKKEQKTLQILENAVKGNLLFDKLSSHTRLAVFDSMMPLEVLAGTTIIQQGDTEATKFYILESGHCNVFVQKGDDPEPKVVHQYKSGSAFGELALLYDQARAATVTATSKCKLWVMERDIYNAIYREDVKRVAKEKEELIAGIPMFSALSSELRSVLVDALSFVEFDANTVIFYKGDQGSSFYIIKSGSVNITSGDKILAKLGPGHYFGDRALRRDNTPRQGTATATSTCMCYILDREQFQKLLGPLEDMWRFEALKTVPILYNLSDMQLLHLASKMRTRTVEADELIIKEGDTGDTFFVIEEGVFSCYKNDGTDLALISKGSCFGELALLRDEQRACNVASKQKGVMSPFAKLRRHGQLGTIARRAGVGRLSLLERAAFKEILGDLSQLRHMWRFEALRRVPLLSSLSNESKAKLCSILRQQSYAPNTEIITQGCGGDTFYIVEAGILAALKDGKPVMRLMPGQYFGELALMRDEPRAATVRALTEVTLLEMDKESFKKTMGSLHKYFTQKASSAYGLVGATDTSLKLKDMKQVACIGNGAFGKVWVVQHKDEYRALKKISKAQVVKSSLVTHVKMEKRIMAECDSPFLVNLVGAFQDETQLYMLMELIMGGELFAFMRKRRKAFRESWAKFYAAAVICAFEYLGARNICYRDLKPENLLIDTNGYLKLTDFGFAKKLAAGGRTYTLCGTPEYLAPEVILQEGHTRAVDWWTVGILIFELVAGLPPFYDQDRVKMFKKAVNTEPKYPAHMSAECADLVGKLLVKQPAGRLGMQMGGVKEVKDHPWYKGFDWGAFEARTMPAPYIPVVKNNVDIRNFVTPKAEEHTDEGYKSVGRFADF